MLKRFTHFKWRMLMLIGAILAAWLFASPLSSPKIVKLYTSPVDADEFATVLLPDGSGTLHIEANVKHANSVNFWITYMEVGAEEDRELLLEDTNGSDGWGVDFPYDKNEGFSYWLIVEAKRGVESDEKWLSIHHDIEFDKTATYFR